MVSFIFKIAISMCSKISLHGDIDEDEGEHFADSLAVHKTKVNTFFVEMTCFIFSFASVQKIQ